MILVIGGAFQGKKAFAKEHLGLTDAQLADASFVVSDYHLCIRKQLEAGLNPEEELKKLVREHPGICIIADEIGSGLIPMERTERDYREAVGRTFCAAAKEADEVWRVICGIGQRIR